MGPRCKQNIAAQHCNQVFIQSRLPAKESCACVVPVICITSLYGVFMCFRTLAVRKFGFLCHRAFTKCVIPTYFLTLPNSVWEEMFGITLLCNLFMVDLLFVFCRSSQGLSSALPCILALGLTMPTVHLSYFADRPGFGEADLRPR